MSDNTKDSDQKSNSDFLIITETAHVMMFVHNALPGSQVLFGASGKKGSN